MSKKKQTAYINVGNIIGTNMYACSAVPMFDDEENLSWDDMSPVQRFAWLTYSHYSGDSVYTAIINDIVRSTGKPPAMPYAFVYNAEGVASLHQACNFSLAELLSTGMAYKKRNLKYIEACAAGLDENRAQVVMSVKATADALLREIEAAEAVDALLSKAGVGQ